MIYTDSQEKEGLAMAMHFLSLAQAIVDRSRGIFYVIVSFVIKKNQNKRANLKVKNKK